MDFTQILHRIYTEIYKHNAQCSEKNDVEMAVIPQEKRMFSTILSEL